MAAAGSKGEDQPRTGLELFTAPTPSGYRATVLLHELGLPYKLTHVDIFKGEQFKPEYAQEVNPFKLIPVLVDHNEGGLRVPESGALSLYLLDCKAPAAGGEAARIAAELLPPPSDPRRRAAVLSQLFWQNSTFYAASTRLFLPVVKEAPYSADTMQYNAKALREQLQVVEGQLQKTGAYLAGDFYSVADVASFPYVLITATALGIDLEAEMPAAHAWAQRLLERPAVRKGMRLPSLFPMFAPGPEGDAAVGARRRKLAKMGVEDVGVGAPRLAVPEAE